MRTVATGLGKREHVHWIYMDHQWQLQLVHLVVALWALRKPHVLIGIEKEAVTRWLFAQLEGRFRFSVGHSSVDTPLLHSF